MMDFQKTARHRMLDPDADGGGKTLKKTLKGSRKGTTRNNTLLGTQTDAVDNCDFSLQYIKKSE
jgi:hypothetical protein